jgi:hypothetical protein
MSFALFKSRCVFTMSTGYLLLALVGEGLAQTVDGKATGLAHAKTDSVTARFDQLEIKTTALPGVGVVDLEYEYTNTGEFPLAIEGFTQSCGCMAGEWDGVPVEPGAKGRIKAKFLTQGLRGSVSKHLFVRFVGSGPVKLVAEVKISESLIYSAHTLHWTLGESPSPKEVDVNVNEKTPLHVLSVSANDPSFSCELKTIKDSLNYKIIITPTDTRTERVCVLQVRTDSKDPRDALQGLFALVEKPQSKEGTP